MFNKKAFFSVLLIGLVITIATANSWAYFQGNIISTGNEIKTGTLYLTTDPDTSLQTIENVSPNSSGTLHQKILNSGTLPGKLKIDFSSIQESVATEVPSATGKDTLLDSVKVNVKLVKADDGSLVQQLAGVDLNTVPIESCSGMSISNIAMDANTAYKLIIYYKVPSDTDNGIEGKKLTFKVTYTLST
jgi:type 1 fimbria pilin